MEPAGFEPLRGWLDQVWGAALNALTVEVEIERT
jgi:hypothetical protein